MDQPPLPASVADAHPKPVRSTMCPAAVHFWFNVRNRILDQRTTAVANELVTVPRNSERIGFLIGSGGGNVNYRPTQWGAAVNSNIWGPAAGNPLKPITIFEYGNLITEPWDFNLQTALVGYIIVELYTPANFLNEIMSK